VKRGTGPIGGPLQRATRFVKSPARATRAMPEL
jgi:hypothetical protein